MSASSRMFDIPDPDTGPAPATQAGHMTGRRGIQCRHNYCDEKWQGHGHVIIPAEVCCLVTKFSRH